MRRGIRAFSGGRILPENARYNALKAQQSLREMVASLASCKKSCGKNGRLFDLVWSSGKKPDRAQAEEKLDPRH